MKRIIGFIIIIVGLIGLVISVAGTYFSFRFVDDLTASVIDTLALTADSLATVEESLELTQTTVQEMNVALGTVEQTADNVSVAIRQTEPLINQVSEVASTTVPDSLEALQDTIPNLVEVAGVIDNTLRTLSQVRIQRDLGLFEIDFDLGVDYDPEAPFDESVSALGETLDGVPEQLRSLDVYLDVTIDNLETISNDINDLADNVNAINSNVAEIIPLIDDYIMIVNELERTIAEVESSIDTNAQYVKIGLLVLFIWFGLNQIMPLYFGWELVSGRRDDDEPEQLDKPVAVENLEAA